MAATLYEKTVHAENHASRCCRTGCVEWHRTRGARRRAGCHLPFPRPWRCRDCSLRTECTLVGRGQARLCFVEARPNSGGESERREGETECCILGDSPGDGQS